MDVSYANQISLTLSDNEVFLRFAAVHPEYEVKGEVKSEPSVDNEHIIVLTKDGFSALKDLINGNYSSAKE